MVPCECGQPFDDLTDWKAHSTATGNCCIHRCRKPYSAASSPGFAFETPTSSTIVTSRASAWKAPTASKGFLNEGYYYNLSDDAWKGGNFEHGSYRKLLPVAWRLERPSSLHTVFSKQCPISSTNYPTKDCSPFHNAVPKVPIPSTRLPNFAYQTPDGKIWPAPVTPTESQAKAFYLSLNSPPVLVPTAIPVVTSSIQPATTPAPMPRQMAAAEDPNARPITSSALKPSTPAATPLAPTTGMRNNVTEKSPSDDRPFGCSHCNEPSGRKKAFDNTIKLRIQAVQANPWDPHVTLAKGPFLGEKPSKRINVLKSTVAVPKCTILFNSESTEVKHFETLHAPQASHFCAVAASRTSPASMLWVNISSIWSVEEYFVKYASGTLIASPRWTFTMS